MKIPTGIKGFLGVALVLSLAQAGPVSAAPPPPGWKVNKPNCRNNIVITAGQGLNFGILAYPPGSGGTVTIYPNNAWDAAQTNSLVGLTLIGGSLQRAAFTFDDSGAQYQDPDPSSCSQYAATITVDASVTLTGPSGTMTLVPWLDNSGSQTYLPTTPWNYNAGPLYVGGQLTVASTQTQGLYSGTFNLTVNWN